MKIVLVAYHYPPDPAVGGLRAAKVARSMRALGHEVRVIAAPLPGATGGTSGEADDGIRVTRVASAVDLRVLYARARRGLRRRSRDPAASEADPVTADPESWTRPTRQPAWKRYIMSALWLPDDRQGWIIPAARQAMREVAQGATLLYTTSPPHSAQLVGLRVKRRMDVRWAMELRDPFSDNLKPDFVRSAWSDAVERWLERRCVRAADHVITVTDAMARRLNGLIPADTARLVVVRNGIDPAAPASDRRQSETPTIVYLGNLYHRRDPRPFFRAVARLRERGGLPRGLRIDFIGDCQYYEGKATQSLAQDAGIGDLLASHGRLPHTECMRRIRDADVLLLLAQEQPDQVPNKLYEYLAARRPILAFTDEAGETAGMLQRATGHPGVSGEDIERAAGALQEALDAAANGSWAPDEAVLEEWTTRRQMERLMRALAL